LVAEIIVSTATLKAARISHQRSLHKRRIAELRVEIESRVSGLFGLSAADLLIVKAVPVPA
jgi:hypothetical protein